MADFGALEPVFLAMEAPGEIFAALIPCSFAMVEVKLSNAVKESYCNPAS